MKIEKIISIEGTIELLSGLHIGGGSDVMHIGGIDSPVIKHPHTNEPYIPGSSLKGKIRSLLEWQAGLVEYNQGKPIGYKQLEAIKKVSHEQEKAARNIIKLFGVSGGDNLNESDAKEIGITRTIFRDSSLEKIWLENKKSRSLLLTEAKSENTINRISGTAEHPRQTERVPSGAFFDFSLQVKILDTDIEEQLLNTLLNGLKLLEMDALGGSGSRGYGRVKFNLSDAVLAEKLAAIDPFAKVA